MRSIPLLIVLICAGFACAHPASVAAGQNRADRKLERLFDKYLEESLKASPLLATYLGDHRFDDRLDDLSKAGRAKMTAQRNAWRKTLAKEIRYDALSRSGQIDYEIWLHDLKRSNWQERVENPFVKNPLSYAPYLSDSIYLPLTQSTESKEKAMRKLVARMKYIPGIVDQAMANLENPPAIWVDRAILRNKGAIGFFKSGLADIAGAKHVRTPAFREAQERVLASLEKYQQFLETDLAKRANGNWRAGKEAFAQQIELTLNAGLSMEEVAREAQREFDRVVSEMYTVAKQLWANARPGQPLPADDKAGRRKTIQTVLAHLAQNHSKSDALIGDARAGIQKIKDFIREKKILTLPAPDTLDIIEMPEFQRGYSIAYLSQAPPLDTKAKSVYAISPPPRDWSPERKKSYFEEYNKYMLQILNIHEGYPGHYVQLEYSNRHPSKLRRILTDGVFAEGWAVYTEQMMLDQGYGEGDLALRLHQLKFYLRTVANALLDHRMHTTQLSDEEATRFLMEDVFQSEGEAVGKVLRSKQGSGQLSTYFVGRTAFYRLRQATHRRLGERFSLQAFHEAVLGHGTLPVKYLPELVEAELK